MPTGTDSILSEEALSLEKKDSRSDVVGLEVAAENPGPLEGAKPSRPEVG